MDVWSLISLAYLKDWNLLFSFSKHFREISCNIIPSLNSKVKWMTAHAYMTITVKLTLSKYLLSFTALVVPGARCASLRQSCHYKGKDIPYSIRAFLHFVIIQNPLCFPAFNPVWLTILAHTTIWLLFIIVIDGIPCIIQDSTYLWKYCFNFSGNLIKHICTLSLCKHCMKYQHNILHKQTTISASFCLDY